jgi:indole-3-pyruvate monooxygenase
MSIHLLVMTKGLVKVGMKLLNCCLPVNFVDSIVVSFAKLHFGDLSKQYNVMSNMGSFLLKASTRHSAVIDVGL